MILYLIVITVCAAAIVAANLLLHTPVAAWGPLGTVLAVVGAVVAVILLDGLGATLIRRLPERHFRHGQRRFAVSRRECRLWAALGVRRWCEKIPELGCFTDFHKDRVREPRNPAYLARFILECNYGVAIHAVNALSGFLLMLYFPLALTVALPVAIVNLVLSALPFMVLRYNTPKLEALLARNERRAAKAAAPQKETV